MQEFLKQLQTAANNFQEEQKNLEERMSKAFQDFLKTLFENDPSVKYVTCGGYTPGFNDGEPCYHSHDFGINYIGMTEEDMDEYGYDLEGIPLTEDTDDNYWNKVREYCKLLDSIGGKYVTSKYETDFIIVWSYVDGEVKEDHHHYDCGY